MTPMDEHTFAPVCSSDLLRDHEPKGFRFRFRAHDCGCPAPLMLEPTTTMDSLANGSIESPTEAEAEGEEEEAVPKSSPAAAITKGRGLRRWRRIQREQLREAYTASARGGGGDEDSAQLHKRRLPLPADAPKGKQDVTLVEEESSTASVESRFVPPAKLDPDLGFLIASAGFSVGAGGGESDNSSKFSTAASAPRVLPRQDYASLLGRERDRPRSRAPAASLHGKNPRAARLIADKARAHTAATSTDGENSRSSSESGLCSSNAVKGRRLAVGGVASNGVLKVRSDDCGHSEPSEEVRSTARLVRRSADSADDIDDEGSVGKEHNGGMHLSSDPYTDSVLLLQRTQEALENEIEKLVAIRNEPSDDFDVHDGERSAFVYLEEPLKAAGERIKLLESRLEKASALMKEKDSRIIELEALVWMQAGKTAIESANMLLSQPELDRFYQEKMEAEIQCTILTRAYETWATLGEDQMALYEAQKSLSEDYKKLGFKLQQAENRAMMLEDMAEKLQVQCEELSRSSEVLQLQSKASCVSLCCFVQFMLLCIAIGIYVMRLLSSSTEVAPT